MKLRLLCIALLLTTCLSAQVTIGTAEAPVQGAMLDLKQETKDDGTANSKKGILLPRVKLTSLAKLKMGDADEILDGTTGEHAKHTGLLVFNLDADKCADKPRGKGIYIWDGKEWQPMGVTVEEVIPAEVNLTNVPDTLHFISGKDLRGSTPAAIVINAEWQPNDKNLGIRITETVGGAGGEDRLIMPSAITTSPSAVSINMMPMTDEDINNDRFAYGVNIDFVATDDCGRELTKQIILNQTHFFLKVNDKISDSGVNFKTTATSTIPTRYNSVWRADVVNDTKSIIKAVAFTEADLVNNRKALIGGQDNRLNGSRFSTIYYQGNVGGTGTKYATADLVFKDRVAVKRWNDITVKIMSCLGTPATPEWDLTKDEYTFATGLAHDKRPMTAQAFSFSWLPTNVGVKWTAIGTNFLKAAVLPTSPISSAVSKNIEATAMLSSEINATNPWMTKTYRLSMTKVDDCATTTKAINFYQTNFAMKINNAFDDSKVDVRDIGNNTFPVQSNNKWKVSVVDTQNILNTLPEVSGGSDKTTGTAITQFSYSVRTTGASTKYHTAMFKFEDDTNPKRAKDISVTVRSCLGTPDMSGLTTATPAQTSGSNTWGTAVIRHLAKAGVYDEFLSADFGLAGRWMTTNISATAYDVRTPGTSWPGGVATTLDAPNYKGDYSESHWGYPNIKDSTNPADKSLWEANRHLGILYNWSGASGKQNPSSADQSGAIHDRIQGICPNGWHLPSDREFTNLENHIKNFTTQHSTMSTNLGTTANDTQYGTDTPSDIPLATAMIDACENKYHTTKSNSPINSGFSLLLAGEAGSYGMIGIGSTTLWSSSSFNHAMAWVRYFNGNSDITRVWNGRAPLQSVRCKKD